MRLQRFLFEAWINVERQASSDSKMTTSNRAEYVQFVCTSRLNMCKGRGNFNRPSRRQQTKPKTQLRLNRTLCNSLLVQVANGARSQSRHARRNDKRCRIVLVIIIHSYVVMTSARNKRAPQWLHFVVITAHLCDRFFIGGFLWAAAATATEVQSRDGWRRQGAHKWTPTSSANLAGEQFT